jgi:hypothetical protein
MMALRIGREKIYERLSDFRRVLSDEIADCYFIGVGTTTRRELEQSKRWLVNQEKAK